MTDLFKKRILIVEDEIPLLSLLRDKLDEQGFEVLTASDGKQGLDVALKTLPDLILLDILMPNMDGLTMLKNLRGNNLAAKLPVILLTNLAESKEVLEAKNFGVEEYLIKAENNLDEVIKKITERANRGVPISPALPLGPN
jgi:two-component system response regulator RpaA